MEENKQSLGSKNKIPFLELIVFSVLFCLNYKKEHNCLNKKIDAHDVRESMENLIGKDFALQDIENVIKTLLVNGHIDKDLKIEDGRIEQSLIKFDVKQTVSDNIRKSYVDRKRLILEYVKLLVYKGKKLSELTKKAIQDELRDISGVTIKQAEIKTVLDSIAGEHIDYNLSTENRNQKVTEELRIIEKLIDMESYANLGIWGLVTFCVICCLKENSEYQAYLKKANEEKKGISNENFVMQKIKELVGCDPKNVTSFVFKDEKDKLMLYGLINRSLNITVKDISNGIFNVIHQASVGPAFATLDFKSFLAFHAIYQMHNDNMTLDGIVKQMKGFAKENSVTLSNIDRRNLPFLISSLYAQGIISNNYIITIPDLRNFQFIINDTDMIISEKSSPKVIEDVRTKRRIIQKCLTEMGCSEENDSEVIDTAPCKIAFEGAKVLEHRPFMAPAYARLDFKSFLAFHALYLIKKDKPSFQIIVEKMQKIAEKHSFELSDVNRRNVPILTSYLYAQGIIDDRRKVTIPDLTNFRFYIRDIDMEKESPETTNPDRKKDNDTKKAIIQSCLTEMGCDDTRYYLPETESDSENYYGELTYFNDEGNVFHHYRTREVENHEQVFIENLYDRSFVENIIGKRESPIIPEFKDDSLLDEFRKGCDFLWECFNAKTNIKHKVFYLEMVLCIVRFIYENTLFVEKLLGIKKPIDISKRLGLNVQGAELLDQEEEEIETIMSLVRREMDEKYVEKVLIPLIRGNDDSGINKIMIEEVREKIYDGKPTIMQEDGLKETRKFIKWIKLIDSNNTAYKTEILNEFQLKKDRVDFLPFVVDLREYGSTEFPMSDKEKDLQEEDLQKENQNRKRALYVLLYNLYRVMKASIA